VTGTKIQLATPAEAVCYFQTKAKTYVSAQKSDSHPFSSKRKQKLTYQPKKVTVTLFLPNGSKNFRISAKK